MCSKLSKADKLHLVTVDCVNNKCIPGHVGVASQPPVPLLSTLHVMSAVPVKWYAAELHVAVQVPSQAVLAASAQLWAPFVIVGATHVIAE